VMATLIAPAHCDPLADAEALRKACQGSSSSSISLLLLQFFFSFQNVGKRIHLIFGFL